MFKNEMNKKLFIAPHCDDETLFGAYTIIREKPLVVIIAADPRRQSESEAAMNILGAGGLIFVDALESLSWMDVEVVYAPGLEGGHPLHDFVSREAKRIWGDKVIQYSTYRSPTDLLPRGRLKVGATKEMEELKLMALDCYKSQHVATPVHFEQVDKSEYLI